MTKRSADRSAIKFSFTKTSLNAIAPPAKRRLYVYDSKTPALQLCVTSTGNKSFYLYRRVNGPPQRIRLGGFPELSVEQARRQAQILNAQIAQGGDPVASKRQVRDETTFRELFHLYLESHAKPHKRSWKEDERQYNVYLKKLHNRPLSKIGRADIATLHTRIGRDNGPYQANRTLALLTHLFNFAASHDWSKSNPCQGVRRFKEQSRDRFMDGGELKKFFESLSQELDITMRDYFIILLLVGARKANTLAMKWNDIDLRRGIWRIDESEFKTKEPLVAILPKPAIDLLQARKKSTNGSPYVFPSNRSKCGHIVDPKAAWTRILERAMIDDLHIHDLRRTLGSWQASLGASLPIIGRSLGHKNTATTAIYARLNDDPVRNSVESAAQAMLAAGDTKLLSGDNAK